MSTSQDSKDVKTTKDKFQNYKSNGYSLKFIVDLLWSPGPPLIAIDCFIQRMVWQAIDEEKGSLSSIDRLSPEKIDSIERRIFELAQNHPDVRRIFDDCWFITGPPDDWFEKLMIR